MFLLLGLMLLHLFQCNTCLSLKPLHLEENVKEIMKDSQEETGELEAVLQKLANLQDQVKELETKLEEGNRVQRETDVPRQTGLEQGWRASPYEMVCAYKQYWHVMDPIV